jgi:hypothetical protein
MLPQHAYTLLSTPRRYMLMLMTIHAEAVERSHTAFVPVVPLPFAPTRLLTCVGEGVRPLYFLTAFDRRL